MTINKLKGLTIAAWILLSLLISITGDHIEKLNPAEFRLNSLRWLSHSRYELLRGWGIKTHLQTEIWVTTVLKVCSVCVWGHGLWWCCIALYCKMALYFFHPLYDNAWNTDMHINIKLNLLMFWKVFFINKCIFLSLGVLLNETSSSLWVSF